MPVLTELSHEGLISYETMDGSVPRLNGSPDQENADWICLRLPISEPQIGSLHQRSYMASDQAQHYLVWRRYPLRHRTQ